MAKLIFIGTGEAFDPYKSNVSYLIVNEDTSIMIDCGYTSAHSLMNYFKDNGKCLLDISQKLLLTHKHGDHTAGIPALIIAMREEFIGSNYKEKREKEN